MLMFILVVFGAVSLTAAEKKAPDGKLWIVELGIGLFFGLIAIAAAITGLK